MKYVIGPTSLLWHKARCTYLLTYLSEVIILNGCQSVVCELVSKDVWHFVTRLQQACARIAGPQNL